MVIDIPILEQKLTGLDFEGSGAYKGQEDLPVQVGFAHMLRGEIEETFSSYLWIDRPINPFASNIHRITNEMLVGKPRFVDLWPIFRPWWGQTLIVAHNTPTEKKHTALFRLSHQPIWIDTLKIARAQYPDLPKHSLEYMMKFFGLENETHGITQAQPHDALYDAVGALLLLKKMLFVSEEWSKLTPKEAQNLSNKAFKKSRKRK